MSAHVERVINEFSAQYYGKIFYFCLKKTGDRSEAEDLASDVALDVITALRKGIIPESFSAYVWKVARNCYYKWTQKRIKHRESFSGEDLDVLNPPSDIEESIENGYIKKEEINSMRREMAFISKEYREILVSFYIDDKKVSQISKEFSLPEGTVKTKLFKSRKILMEGMKMAREFGPRSYKPENVNFGGTGNHPSGLPNSALERQIPKNIILQAHNNPSTVEELSMELGIAAPYMEEETKLLADADLLKEVDGKYVTNFFIADKECQLEVYNAQRRQSKERSKLLDEIITDSLPEIRKVCVANGDNENISDNALKWLFVPSVIDMAKSPVKEDVWNIFKRPDGGNWGIMGFETHNLIDENKSTWHNGNGNNANMFWRYTYVGYDIGGQVNSIGYNELLLLSDMIRNNRKTTSLTESEKNFWKNINENIVTSDESGDFSVNIPVFKCSEGTKTFPIISKHPKWEALNGMISSLFEEVREILKKYSNPVLHEHINYYVGMFMHAIRKMSINDGVESGSLTLPENAENSTIGMYLNIE